MRSKLLIALFGLGCFVAGAIAWWLLSPLFLDRAIDELFPGTTAAAGFAETTMPAPAAMAAGDLMVPDGVDPAAVLAAMDTMAKVEVPAGDDMPAPGSAALARLRTGTFRDGDALHHGSGSASIYRLPDGSHVLRLEPFRVTNGPALHVLLSPHADPRTRDELKSAGYVDLGGLKGNVGSQNYVLPPGTDPTKIGSVIIYCKPFQVLFTVAPLAPAAGPSL